MKTRLFFLLPLALLLSGCPADADKETEPEKTCQLQESVAASGGVVFTNRYSYNTALQLTGVTQDSLGATTDELSLQYNSDRQLVEVTGKSIRLAYTYNAQNQLLKQSRSYRKTTSGAYEEQDYYTFSYNTNNELAEARYFYTGNGGPSLFYSWKYTYTNGNPTTIEQVSAREDRIALTKFTYDGRPVIGQPVLYSFFQPQENVKSANYLSSYTITDHNGGSSTYTLVYTFAEEGQAKTVTKTGKNGFQETRTYTYRCQ